MDLDYRSLLDNIREGVYFTDLDRLITYWNERAEKITGYQAEAIVGHRCRDNLLVHVDGNGQSMCRGRCPLAAAMEDRVVREAQVYLHHKDGHRVPVHVRAFPLLDKQGRVVGGAEFFSDTSAQETLQQRMSELEKLALLDPLTQLPNRHHMEPELEARFHEMERLDLFFGLLFIDIDHFKSFNDTYGHDVGDRTLITVAKTLNAAVRPFDLVGRWGGEEFIAIIRSITAQQLAVIAERLRLLVRQSTIAYMERRLCVTVSVGGTMVIETDTTASLIKRADALMYQSKKNGRDLVTIG